MCIWSKCHYTCRNRVPMVGGTTRRCHRQTGERDPVRKCQWDCRKVRNDPAHKEVTFNCYEKAGEFDSRTLCPECRDERNRSKRVVEKLQGLDVQKAKANPSSERYKELKKETHDVKEADEAARASFRRLVAENDAGVVSAQFREMEEAKVKVEELFGKSRVKYVC